MSNANRKMQHPVRHKESGLSLVLVLFAVLCLSFLIVLFFSLASNDRASTAAFTNAIKAEELGTGGLELVIGELRKEISDSDRSTTQEDVQDKGPTLYIPKGRAYMVPERTASDPLGNLVKVSGSTTLFSGASATLRGSSASSSTPSRNGRSVSAERWNKTALAQFSGSATPVWIYMNRKGPVNTFVPADASDPTKPGFILGRIAFAIYDIGGLLDVNVAGYPSTLPKTEAARKGSPALVSLQGLGISEEAVADIVNFRNAKSGLSGTTYKDYLEGDSHKGFTRTVEGDNRFLSRQELIRFARRSGFENQLRFLTVFSREKNAPSYQPSSSVESNANPSLAALRHSATRRLMFEKRFPLHRIKLLENPTDPENAADILQYFGLTYDQASRSFTYNGSTIKTATQIAENETDYRELNFFELLKASIEQGSIGQSAGATATVPDDPNKDAHIIQIGANIIDQYDLDPDRDSAGIPIPIPTTINFGLKKYYGVESLPYLNKITFVGELLNGPGATFNGQPNNMAVGNARPAANLDSYAFMIAAELWNPHFQNLPASSTPSLQIYNPQVRIAVTGGTKVVMYASEDVSDPPGGSPAVGPLTPPQDLGDYPLNATQTYKANENRWSGSDYQNYFFVEPKLLRLDKVVPSQFSYNKLTKQAGNPDYLRFCFNSAKINITAPISVELAVLDKDGIPRTYQKSLDTAVSSLEISKNAGPNSSSARVNRSTSLAHSDPRTNRLGYFGVNYSPYRVAPMPASASENPIGSLPIVDGSIFAPNATYPFSLRPRFDKFTANHDPRGVATSQGVPADAFEPKSTGLYLGLLWENTNLSTRIQDPDGVFRQGDGGFSPEAASLNPMEPIAQFRNSAVAYPSSNAVRKPGANPSRPVILDRPFRSVADLGYVHRDIPWRSLNFSGTDSADSALLDAFSIEDADSIEGRVNLNSASVDVLKALLVGSLKEEKPPTSTDPNTLSIGEAEQAAARLKSFISSTSSGPIMNISELVTKFSTPGNISNAEVGAGVGGESSAAIKAQRESLIRALAGTTQTRTWNFLIDLVAQTGRFPKDARNENDFTVEGERRYWLHIAIDRYTGEVVSELLETVND